MRRLAIAAAALMPLPAAAQAYQCSAPATLGAPAPVVPDGPVRRLPITGYTLSASWSPEHCRTAKDRGSLQCSGVDGRFGFVLHGLWPEARPGTWPQWCAMTQTPAPALIRANLCMTPSPDLIRHEWAKHGSCMARRPEDYLRIEARLWRGLDWPDADRLAKKPALTAGDLRAAFSLANQGWRAEEIGLLVDGSGWLQEVRLCLDRRLHAKACARSALGPADGARLKIWRGL